MDKKTAVNDVNLIDERRIWVGNLDPRLNEFQLLKLLQKCGKIEKFDMLFHKNGPMAGQSRGYAFVTFAKVDAAVAALDSLNGTQVANRPLIVRFAKNANFDEYDKPKPRIEIPALGTGKLEGKVSKRDVIRAIEAKLKTLERQSNDLQLNTTIAGGSKTNGGPPVPIIQRFQFNKDRDNNGNGSSSSGQRSNHSRGPYNRHHRSHHRR